MHEGRSYAASITGDVEAEANILVSVASVEEVIERKWTR